jgi:hypothetical protein
MSKLVIVVFMIFSSCFALERIPREKAIVGLARAGLDFKGASSYCRRIFQTQ